MALLTAAAVLACLTVGGVGVFGLASRALIGRAADDLAEQRVALRATAAAGGTLERVCVELRDGRQGPPPLPGLVVLELVRPDGTVCRRPASQQVTGPAGELPDSRLLGVDLPLVRTSDGGTALLSDDDLGSGWRLRLGKDVEGYASLLRQLQGMTTGLSLFGAASALLAGWLVTRAGLQPVRELADEAARIARTQDLTGRVAVRRSHPGDEVTRLAESFDAMTRALSAARERQVRLVADAGHELRTPLTSLRTNVDLLVRSERSGRPLPPGEHRALLTDLTEQLEELTGLTEELAVLAHEEPAAERRTVRLDAVVAAAVRRAGRRAGGRPLESVTEPWSLPDADAAALERAVLNVVDNALKFSPAGSPVRVRQAGGRVAVDDAGPGIPPAQRHLVTERFWRSDDARGRPGSGLGMAIAADAVTGHGGSVTVTDSPSGGARVVLTLPGGSAPAQAAVGGPSQPA